MVAEDAVSSIHQHSLHDGAQWMDDESHPPIVMGGHTVLVLITDVHRGMIPALEYALSLGSDNIIAVYVDLDSGATQQLRAQWQKWELAIPLVILASPRGSLLRPVLRFVDQVTRGCAGNGMTIILPVLVSAKWWHRLLHNQPAFLLKAALVLRKGKFVASVPYRLEC
jgi:hypothetical protein